MCVFVPHAVGRKEPDRDKQGPEMCAGVFVGERRSVPSNLAIVRTANRDDSPAFIQRLFAH